MTSPSDDNNVLDGCTAPLHAFPSPYPPVCSYEPFSLESRGQMFSVLQWERRPNHNISSRPPDTDMNDLVDSFALLSVRDIYSKRAPKDCGAVQDSLAATYAITITPSLAPHPALINEMKTMSPLARWSPFPVVRALQPTSQVFTKSAALSIRILPHTLSEDLAVSRRKVSPLPKRCPQSPLLCHNMTPATPDASSSSPSPCSSLCSLSDSCDFGRSSSPVSCPGPLMHEASSPQS